MIAWVEVPVSTKDGFVMTLVDADDFLNIGGRALSMGSHGYPQIWADGKMQTLHRWLMGATGDRYKVVIDHINRNTLDNRRRNLRAIDPSLSNANRRIAEGPFYGAYRTRSGRWQAKFKWRGQNYYLGTFDTREGAARAVRRYRMAHCPDSFPPEILGGLADAA